MNIKKAIDDLPEGVRIAEISVTLYQPSDTCQPEDEGQEMTIKTQPGGEGSYIVISTARWAIDEGDELDDVANLAEAIREIMPND